MLPCTSHDRWVILSHARVLADTLPGMCQSVVFPCEGQRAKGWMQIPTDFAHQTLGGQSRVVFMMSPAGVELLSGRRMCSHDREGNRIGKLPFLDVDAADVQLDLVR